ncbi:peptidase S8/S53 domain-containing protein [Syncephalis fuscata]|nr:peptidase S8/S53 domain-containing protein [Syncephalis fuscata]
MMKSTLITTLLLMLAASNGLAQQQRSANQSRFLAPPSNHPATNILSEEPDTAAVAPQQNNFRQELRNRNIGFDERFSFSTSMNALSLELDTTNIDLRVWPIRKVFVPHFEGLPYTHTMTGVDILHTKNNLGGAGLRVGVIDTGLGGCFGPKCRVATGWDFVGDAYTGGKTLPVPDADPRDTCAGHGTHVAGIIGADDATFVGVAPKVTFGAYRVFGCKGSAENDVIIAALERAFKEKMDIVNLSLGGDSSWGQSPDAVVAERLSRKGLIVVAAMGNSATKGLWEASSPAIAPSAFSVASLDNIKYRAYTLSLASAPTKHFPYASSKEGAVNMKTAAVSVYDAGDNKDACKPTTVDLKNKVVLIKRGTCSFVDKAKNAQQAGAIGVIVYNNVFGSITPGVEDPAVTIPVVGVAQADGEALVAGVQNDAQAQIVFSSEQLGFENPTAGRLSSFSSWGPGPRVEMKPDIGAPGGMIYSTYPLDMGKYATLSGTSMATPYMAGSIALYLEATKKRNLNLGRIHQLFQNTARPTTEVKADQRTSPVARQGAGLLNVERAIYGTTLVSPSRIALNDTEHAPASQQVLRITNNAKRARDYYITHRPAASVNGLDVTGVALPEPQLNDEAASVSFSTTRIRIAAGETEKITVRISEPKNLPAAEHWVYSGYIVINTATSATANITNDAVHVPYLGMKGNLKDLHVMKQRQIAYQTATYQIADNDFPELVYRIEYPTRKVQARVYNATTRKLLGLIPGSLTEWVGRNDNSPGNAVSVIQWPGTLVTLDARQRTSDLPDGKYYVELMALRPYGKAHHDADYDIWRSPTVTFKRANNKKIVSALW